jgi:hypothetical protein
MTKAMVVQFEKIQFYPDKNKNEDFLYFIISDFYLINSTWAGL